MNNDTKIILNSVAQLLYPKNKTLSRNALSTLSGSLFEVTQTLKIALFIEEFKEFFKDVGLKSIALGYSHEGNDEGGINTYFHAKKAVFTEEKREELKLVGKGEIGEHAEAVCDRIFDYLNFTLVSQEEFCEFLDINGHFDLGVIEDLFISLSPPQALEVMQYLKTKGSQITLDSYLPSSGASSPLIKLWRKAAQCLNE